MKRLSFKFAIASTLLLSPLLGGCAVAVIGGLAAAGGAGYEAAQERGVNGTFDDMNLHSRINNALNNQYGDITTTIYDGKVLLTGSSPNPQARAQAEQVARAQGVSAVFNEITVGPVEDPTDYAKDSWITGRVRSELMFDADVRSGNYTIETDRQSVYLLGSARSQAELDKATQLARYVPGVQRVVSYVDVRYGSPTGGAPPTAQAAPPPGSRSGYAASGSYQSNPSYAAPGGRTTSNAPIQVQRLN
jgi:osmotically-inducible protein OsmY